MSFNVLSRFAVQSWSGDSSEIDKAVKNERSNGNGVEDDDDYDAEFDKGKVRF